MLRRFTLVLLSIAVCTIYAQTGAELFEKAPPHLDEALRARVTQFYESQGAGKYRAAEQLVSEESKDAYIGADKPRCDGFELFSIKYEENFSKARVAIACGTWAGKGSVRAKVKMPVPSLWKLVDNQWYWYVEPKSSEGMQSPFGVMRPGPDVGGESPTAFRMPSVREIMSKLKFDKKEVQLSSYQEASDEVTITNDMPGAISLNLVTEGAPAGYSAKLDKTELKSGESAKIRFHCKPVNNLPKHTATAKVQVQPFNQTIPLRVVFAVPPEILKQIPK